METKSAEEGKVFLRDASWETYERLIEERGEKKVPRFHYDRGVMEIMSSSKKHEEIGYVVGDFVGLLSMEMELDLFGAGSTTFKSERFGRGFEPDECFYLGENAEVVRGKENIELDSGDPPPNLVVEVDITNPSLDKLGIYSRLGIPEVWRFSGGAAEIFALRDGEYEAADTSLVFSSLSREILTRFIQRGLTMKRPAWAKEVREWVAG